MDYSYLNQPATDPNYRNKIDQNVSQVNRLGDDPDPELLLANDNSTPKLD